MVQSRVDWSSFVAGLSEFGLSVFGGLIIDEADCPDGHEALTGRLAILVGNAGKAMWEVFSHSPEYSDEQPHALDRWTRRVITQLADTYDANSLFPFEKPYWPFQRFAMRAGHANSSPLGILIHPQFGLWHGFRAVVLVSEEHSFASNIRGLLNDAEELIHPCKSCAEKPCLSACPVDAFDGVTLDRGSCHNHLRSSGIPKCMTLGCRARDACPVGSEYRYDTEQIQFHMKAFLG